MSDIDLELPDFLRRHKDEVRPAWTPSAPQVQAEEQWRTVERERTEARKLKSRGRVAKMLKVRADREAAAAGKVWDVHKGRWR